MGGGGGDRGVQGAGEKRYGTGQLREEKGGEDKGREYKKKGRER